MEIRVGVGEKMEKRAKKKGGENIVKRGGEMNPLLHSIITEFTPYHTPVKVLGPLLTNTETVLYHHTQATTAPPTEQ